MTFFRYSIGIILLFCASQSQGQWMQETNYPGGIDDEAVAFSIGDTLYVGAGSTGATSFYKFDPSSNTWSPKGHILSRAAGVSFSIGSKGYAALGQSETNVQSSVTNDFWQYDPVSDSWTLMPSFPGAKRDAAIAFVIGNKAFVGGGYDATSTKIFDDFYSFDPSINKWDTLNALPDYIAFGTTFVIGNDAYLTAYEGSTAESSSVWQYNPSSDRWNQMNDFPGSPRESAVAFSLNGVGYLGLGQTEYSSTFNDFYSYDTASDTWTTLSFPGESNGLGWASAATIGNAGFIALGSSISGPNLTATNGLWEFSLSASVAADNAPSLFSLYPNPATDNIHIADPTGTMAEISVRNSLGIECLSATLTASEELNVASLPAEMYEVEIRSGDHRSFSRFVKE